MKVFISPLIYSSPKRYNCLYKFQYKINENVFILLIQFMGQQTSLNCKTSDKPEQHEIQTSHGHVVQLMRAQNQKRNSQISEPKQKQSTLVASLAVSSTALDNNLGINNNEAIPAQHENILKIAASPFVGGEKFQNRYVEKGSKSLAEIIQARYNSNMHFPQAQVVCLIESLVYSLAYLQQLQYNHHDFYPTNIYYCNGIFKITNPLMVQTSAYMLTQERKRFSFLSPEQINDILEEIPESQISKEVMFKSDIFSIGMIVLEFCTLQPSAECYDQESYSLVDKIIKQRLIKVQALYSPAIADCIAEMLRYEVEERIEVRELSLLVFLNSNKEKIPKEAEQQQIRNYANKPPLVVNPPRSYQLNPPHVQPQYVILPPSSINLPPGQGLPLNPNSIAIPTPNYTYSRIGPNNQSLMSSTTLQNKLRVIQLIHQNSQQQEQPQENNHNFLSKKPSKNGSPQKYQIQKFPPNISAYNSYQNVPMKQFQQSQVYYPYKYNSPARIQQPKRQLSPGKRSYYDEEIKPSIQKYSNDEIYQEKKAIANLYPGTNSSLTDDNFDNSFTNRIANNSSYNKSRNRVVDQNGETLEQRVERILQMSRSIK